MEKSIEVTKALFEEMASNNYYWSSERASLKEISGEYNVDAVDFLAGKVDTLAQLFKRFGATNLKSS